MDYHEIIRGITICGQLRFTFALFFWFSAFVVTCCASLSVTWSDKNSHALTHKYPPSKYISRNHGQNDGATVFFTGGTEAQAVRKRSEQPGANPPGLRALLTNPKTYWSYTRAWTNNPVMYRSHQTVCVHWCAWKGLGVFIDRSEGGLRGLWSRHSEQQCQEWL